MIHTDGRPTIANYGSDRDARIENLARDIASVYGCTLEEARKRISSGVRPRNVFVLPSLADTLVSDDEGLN